MSAMLPRQNRAIQEREESEGAYPVQDQSSQVTYVNQQALEQYTRRLEVSSGFRMEPRTFEEAKQFCELMADSDMVAHGYKAKPGNIFVAIQMGYELGMTPMRAMRAIKVINGGASMYGDDLLAMVQASPVCEYIHENESRDELGVCEVKRKGDPESLRITFSKAQAIKAGLWSKQGPWQQYPDRMLKMRARGFALRDKFSDVLCGLITTEEAMDIPTAQEEVGQTKLSTIEGPATLKERLKQATEQHGDGSVSASHEEETPATSQPVGLAPETPGASASPDFTRTAYDYFKSQYATADSPKEIAIIANAIDEANLTDQERSNLMLDKHQAIGRIEQREKRKKREGKKG